jgi:hypothetical protein
MSSCLGYFNLVEFFPSLYLLQKNSQYFAGIICDKNNNFSEDSVRQQNQSYRHGESAYPQFIMEMGPG